MMRWVVVIGLFILILIAAILLVVIPAPKTAVAPTDGVATTTPIDFHNTIVFESVTGIHGTITAPGGTNTSPIVITGEAIGSWYFEASFPVKLLNASGTVIAQSPAQAQGDWMTTDFVPFSVTLNFSPQPSHSVGTLVLHNDNPSGDPSKQKELDIPVVFK